ncbi:hypothetical protein KL933_002361 [Ogataea haglerorum]|uniref:DUF3020 domain-containing protein n=1 Tax=Ogataea haglerorum TaxID=1937702 RepID=A0AAN6I0C3_9ASCO|nr:uncharacterized protein KL911_003313 [Ogataea haglerorum]KAG7696053.1 hypothetical protein KL951_003578 [Ogataea haglerorum]KAG7727427.1 hypothetical protein KL933_002361 [Ogataea haglerorum]KAG7737611.1 hypothetical protein KL923_004000 [Ogataea haglerorum]KAG7747541.1 hypothetical protein KL912_003565 [Ogataea haglerorum]KAG7753208.1 hypothetical protein KL911_003313 [Ogataea haglerorum]
MPNSIPPSENKPGDAYHFDENEIFDENQLRQAIEDALHADKDKQLFTEINSAIQALDGPADDAKPDDELTQAIAEAIDHVKPAEHAESGVETLEPLGPLESLGLPLDSNEPELESALAEMVQTVVDTNLFPDKDAPKKHTETDLEQFQWTKMMEKAMEMAMENPEHLISSLNDADPGEKLKKKQTAKSKRSQINLAVQQRLQQQARALLAQQQRDRELRQRLEQDKQQTQKSAAEQLPASVLQFTVPTPPTSIPGPVKSGEKASVLEQFQKFQRPDDNKSPSVADTLAAQREKMLHAYAKQMSRTLPQASPPAQSYAKKSEGSFLRTILSSLNLAHLDTSQIAEQISPPQLEAIRVSVSSAVDVLRSSQSLTKAAPNSSDKQESPKLDDKERIRIENRERKKRWRVINIERNRDNDLRARVIKRAGQIFTNPEDEEIKKKWIAEEFERRKRKRLEKNGTDAPLVQSNELEHRSESVAALLADPQVSANIHALYQTLCGAVPSDDKLATVSVLATSLAAAYVVSNKSLSENLVPSIVSSLVNSLNNQLNGPAAQSGTLSFKVMDPAPKHATEPGQQGEVKKVKIDPDLINLPDHLSKFARPTLEEHHDAAYARPATVSHQPRAPHYQRPPAEPKPSTPTVRSIVSKTPVSDSVGGLRKPGAFRKPVGFEKRGFGIAPLPHKGC